MASLNAAKLSAEQSKDLDDIAGILFIISGSLYHKNYPNPRIWWIGWLILLSVYIFGYFPGWSSDPLGL
jgi:hypothetical protein